ncbi:MAG TPA: 5'-nucleotidase C-terminal domain-containing protein [Bacillota bacterium]
MVKKRMFQSSLVMAIITVALMFNPVVFSAEDRTPTEGDHFTLSIMHMNDTHAHLDPMPKMVTAVKEVRKEKPEALLLHAGDVFSGTLYFNEFKGQADLALMNLMDVDAMVFGNHEFDLGDREGGQQSLAKFVEGAHFPLLSTNIDFSNDPYMSALVSPEQVVENPEDGTSYQHIVKEVDGEKIGIFGLTTEDTIDISSPVHVAFNNYQEAAEEAVQLFEQQDIDKIIAVTHMGYDSNPAVGNDLLLAQIEGIDVIVGGHSHTKLEQPVVVKQDANGQEKDPTVIVQAGQYAEYLGTLDVAFDDEGVVVRYAGGLLEVDAYAEDEEAVEVLQPYKDKVNHVMNEKSGATALKELTNPRQSQPGDDSVRANETELGNLVTDAMLTKAQEKFPETVIAFQNGGGIRAPIAKGEMTIGEIISVLPFGNDPVIATLTGAEIKEILEHSVHLAPSEHGGFLHVSGMRMTYDSSKEAGNRVQTMEVKQGEQYVPIESDQQYQITTNGFTGQGGDGFETFAKAYEEGRIKDIGEIDWQQLRDYMVEDLGGKVDPEREGRIIDLAREEDPRNDDDHGGKNGSDGSDDDVDQENENEEKPGEDSDDQKGGVKPDGDSDDDSKKGSDGADSDDSKKGSKSTDDDEENGNQKGLKLGDDSNKHGNRTVQGYENNEGSTATASSDSSGGGKLPRTATNMFTYFLIGSILLLSGGGMLFYRKKADKS